LTDLSIYCFIAPNTPINGVLNRNQYPEVRYLMSQWHCVICDWTYDEALGDPESGVAPGTKFEDIPDDWMCPDCGVGKDDFELIEN